MNNKVVNIKDYKPHIVIHTNMGQDFTVKVEELLSLMDIGKDVTKLDIPAEVLRILLSIGAEVVLDNSIPEDDYNEPA